MGLGGHPTAWGWGWRELWKAGNSGRIVAVATTGARFLINISTVYEATSVGEHLPNLDHEKSALCSASHHFPDVDESPTGCFGGSPVSHTNCFFVHCGLWLKGKEKQCSGPLAEKAN